MADRTAFELESRFPNHTIVKYNYVPCLRAASAMAVGDAPVALVITSTASTYELGGLGLPFYPIYLRGLSYLGLRDSHHAIAEFQKILNHRGVVINGALRPMAQLGIARAYVLSADHAKAIGAYQSFFSLWKDADQDTPLLKAARAEYTKLR